MTDDTWNALDSDFAEFPSLRSGGASQSEIDLAAQEIGLPFPRDYEEFLRRYGAAMVGSYPIFGLRQVEAMGTCWSVVQMNEHFKKMNWPGTNDWVIFTNDLGGNPLGFDRRGRVSISDTDFGEISEISTSFEEFLRKKCLKL
ncbi:MAG: SMI1/KNR4 family protein [Thermoanaerobaculia bacterium]|jgi:hypothetical protein